jgi:beta-lactamase class A
MNPRLVRRVPPVLLRAALAAAVLGAGFGAGWLARGRLELQAAPPMRMIRDQGPARWRFINPLLDCDGAEGLLQRPALISFKDRITGLIASHREAGEIMTASVYFRELNDGAWIGIGERLDYIPASLLKLPTLIAILKRAERDPSFLAQRVVFSGRRDDNAIIAYRPADTLEPGRSYTVGELCRRMVQYSDNNATGLLNSIVTMPEQNETLRGLGVLPELVRARGKLGVKSVSSFLRVLYNASFLSRENSELALEMLAKSSFRDGIIGGLPGGVPVCSKYGEAAIGEGIVQLHEFAIVYHEQRPYLLGVMTQGHDFQALARCIREVSRTVYEEVDRQSRTPAGVDRSGSSGPAVQ